MTSKTIIGAGLLALMILCALCVLRHYPYSGHTAATAVAVSAPMAAPTATPISNVALLPPFAARLDAGKVTLEGTVPDQPAKDRILATALASFGAGNFNDTLTLAAPGAASFGADWLNSVLGWLPFLGRFGNRGDIAFNGQTLTVSGEVPTQEIKIRLLDELRTLYGQSTTIVDQLTVTESLLSESEAKVQADLKQLLLKGVEFDTGSDKVTNVGADTLNQLVPALAAAPDVPVEISGHTDNRGTEPSNQELSQRRAQSVKTYLTGKGIAAARMTTRGFGSTQPIADNATLEGQARNRRIEFRVVPRAR